MVQKLVQTIQDSPRYGTNAVNDNGCEAFVFYDVEGPERQPTAGQMHRFSLGQCVCYLSFRYFAQRAGDKPYRTKEAGEGREIQPTVLDAVLEEDEYPDLFLILPML